MSEASEKLAFHPVASAAVFTSPRTSEKKNREKKSNEIQVPILPIYAEFWLILTDTSAQVNITTYFTITNSNATLSLT